MTDQSATDFDNMASAIPYPSSPKKPVLNRKDFGSNKEFHLALAEAEDRFEADKLQVKDLRREYGEAHKKLDCEFWEWALDSEDANYLPDEVLYLVKNYACEEGHSGGYSEIYNKFLDIIDIAKAAYKAGVEHEKAEGAEAP